MPASYVIDVQQGIVFSRGWGLLLADDILAHAKALRADTDFYAGFRQITDFLAVTDISVTADDVERIAELNPFRPDARRAFVVPSDELYGLVRMYWSHTGVSTHQFGLFRMLAPAMEWIGLAANASWPEGEPHWTSE